jgi:multidrug efflux pump subunit AcrB
LTSIIVFSAMARRTNVITLGELALAVGILVDDVTIEVKNIDRNRSLAPPQLDRRPRSATPKWKGNESWKL